MKITRKQIRKIVEEEIKRDLPISYYSDEMIMQEGLLDFLGGLFGKLVDFLFGDAEKAAGQTVKYVSSSANDNVGKAAKELGVEDVDSLDDIDMEKEKQRPVWYFAVAPVISDTSQKAIEMLGQTEAVKDWTPADDSDEAAKKWQEENGDAAGGLYSAGGTVMGLLQMFGEKELGDAEAVRSAGEAASKESPGALAQWLAGPGPEAVASIIKGGETGDPEMPTSYNSSISAAAESMGAVAEAAKSVAAKIADSGEDQAEEEKNESLELRKLINGLVLQERARNI